MATKQRGFHVHLVSTSTKSKPNTEFDCTVEKVHLVGDSIAAHMLFSQPCLEYYFIKNYNTKLAGACHRT